MCPVTRRGRTASTGHNVTRVAGILWEPSALHLADGQTLRHAEPMVYRAATTDVPARPRVHSATWVAIVLGFTSIGLALGALWGVLAYGLFAAPPTLTLLPVAAAAFDAVVTVMSVRRARRLSRAPRRHAFALVLAGVAIVVTVLAAFLWTQLTLDPPEPLHFESAPLPHFNNC